MQLHYCCLPLNFRKFFRAGILKNTCKRLYLFQSTFTCLKTNTAQRCEICAKQTMKTPEWRQWPRSGVYLLLTLNIIHISFWRFYYWLQVLMCLLDYKERNFKYYWVATQIQTWNFMPFQVILQEKQQFFQTYSRLTIQILDRHHIVNKQLGKTWLNNFRNRFKTMSKVHIIPGLQKKFKTK